MGVYDTPERGDAIARTPVDRYAPIVDTEDTIVTPYRFVEGNRDRGERALLDTDERVEKDRGLRYLYLSC